MLKRYLWMKNFVFLSLFAFLGAQIGNRVILANLPGDPSAERPPMVPHSQPHRKHREKKTLSSYKVITKRNIFNSEYVPPDAVKPNPQNDVAAPPQKTELNVQLIGTVVGAPQDSFAIVQDLRSRKQELFQIDDIIQGEARVTRIDRCRVLVLRSGQEEILECPEDGEEAKASRRGVRTPAPAAGSGEGDSVKKVSENEYLIDESEVEDALNNINRLMTQIRVVPNFQDGQTNGFKVFAIKPNSIFSKIGLKNGDVIQRINDQEITTPDKAFQAFNVLRNEKSLSVDILRRGAKQSLSYEIR